MHEKLEVTDCNGEPVRVGDRIRLLRIEGNLLERVPDDEVEDIKSMIGEVFEVTEIDKYGMAWVSKSWNREEGTCMGHSLALSAREMQRVAPEDAN